MTSKNDNYTEWRKEQFIKNEGFFPIFSDFRKVMRYLSPGAISLYVYLGLHSNYKTGEVFHSLGKIAIHFGKSTRTISNWMKELENLQLIKREQFEVNKVSHTFLQPYSVDNIDLVVNNTIEEENF